MTCDARTTKLSVTLKRSSLPARLKTTDRATKKSVLYLIADDMRPELRRAFNQSRLLTPNFDELAATSMTFLNAYCQQAVIRERPR